jgi:predicted tellurium resistance membrane protein TerC
VGKFISVTAGAIVFFIGLVLLIAWWYEFSFVLRAIAPALLIFGGIIAIFAGINEFKDTLKAKSTKKASSIIS